jgi:hypothetical protein
MRYLKDDGSSERILAVYQDLVLRGVIAEELHLLAFSHEQAASNSVAGNLRAALSTLQKKMSVEGAAPVRVGGELPQSVISELAADLLEGCHDNGVPPGLELTLLIRELLSASKQKSGMSRKVRQREDAIFALALHPEIGVRELAKIVGVAPSTVSKWIRDDQEFMQWVGEIRGYIERDRALGLWPPNPMWKRGPNGELMRNRTSN